MRLEHVSKHENAAQACLLQAKILPQKYSDRSMAGLCNSVFEVTHLRHREEHAYQKANLANKVSS